MAVCRLCNGSATAVFETTVLAHHEVAFFRCSACGSLQTEEPYWLTEAYESALVNSDTGAVYRSLSCQAAIMVVAKIMRLNGAFLDYGGGGGLLCRLLRDVGLKAFTYDKYADPIYARAFSHDVSDFGIGTLSMISAIEVFEHCAAPFKDLNSLFVARPEILFATTIPYRNEGANWWYISSHSGQHVFFYSSKALRWLGEQFGYSYMGVDCYHIFCRSDIGRLRRIMLRMGLSKVGRRLACIWLAATRTSRFVTRDYESLRKHDEETRDSVCQRRT